MSRHQVRASPPNVPQLRRHVAPPRHRVAPADRELERLLQGPRRAVQPVDAVVRRVPYARLDEVARLLTARASGPGAAEPGRVGAPEVPGDHLPVPPPPGRRALGSQTEGSRAPRSDVGCVSFRARRRPAAPFGPPGTGVPSPARPSFLPACLPARPLARGPAAPRPYPRLGTDGPRAAARRWASRSARRAALLQGPRRDPPPPAPPLPSALRATSNVRPSFRGRRGREGGLTSPSSFAPFTAAVARSPSPPLSFLSPSSFPGRALGGRRGRRRRGSRASVTAGAAESRGTAPPTPACQGPAGAAAGLRGTVGGPPPRLGSGRGARPHVASRPRPSRLRGPAGAGRGERDEWTRGRVPRGVSPRGAGRPLRGPGSPRGTREDEGKTFHRL